MFFTTCNSSCLKEKFKTALVWLDSQLQRWEAWAKAHSGECSASVLSQAVQGDRHSDPRGNRCSPLPAWRGRNPGRGWSDFPRVTLRGHGMVAGEPGPCSTVGKGQTGDFTKSGCQIGVLLANRKVSITLICLLLSKRRKRKKICISVQCSWRTWESWFFFLIKSLNESKNISVCQTDGALISWGLG